MTERYFEKFKIIEYANTAVIDITQRTVILNTVYNNYPSLYYLYEIQANERADNLASKYYDDPYMSWILYLNNKIIDPYYDWNIDDETFKSFIIKKYGTLEKATNRVKYYRNNWYLDQEQISVSAYNSLNQTIKRYYEPVYLNEYKDTVPNAYRRKQVDWKYNTNGVARYAVANGSSFSTDEIVTVVFDANNIGRGQVSYSNATHVVLQHLTGVTTNANIVANSYLYGIDSKSNTVFTTATSVSNNISAVEAVYWSPVTYLEYETELNINNLNIRLLDSRYSSQIAKELKVLLK